MINRYIDDMLLMLKRFSRINRKISTSMQVDEPADFTGKSNIVSFVRFVNDGKIQENFFCCKELPKTSK
jgi:protein involved in sex pheromone biosynthesis